MEILKEEKVLRRKTIILHDGKKFSRREFSCEVEWILLSDGGELDELEQEELEKKFQEISKINQ